MPAGTTRKVPAVVIAHGSAGVDRRGGFYAEALNQTVVATLEIDMWAARGWLCGITGLSAALLGMDAAVSEDTVRRALKAMEDELAAGSPARERVATLPLLSAPWILDTDVTVKPLYGKQEGALICSSATTRRNRGVRRTPTRWRVCGSSTGARRLSA